MTEHYTGVRLVPVLAAFAAPTGEGFLQVSRVDVNLVFGGLLHDCHSHRGGMNPAPLLGRGYPLETVAPRFSAEGLFGSAAGYSDEDEAGAFLDHFVVKDAPAP